MVKSGLIANGSVRGIINGTHFNRCKKVHAISALSFKILHFHKFMEYYQKLNHEERLSAECLKENLEYESRTHQASSVVYQLKDLIDHYNVYSEKTLNGDHGYTAQFVLKYVQFVELYQIFEYAIRTSDLNLYMYSAYKICSLFFAFNHQNYARWLTKNIDDLINIDETHPGLASEFKSGALSIRRTAKNFCRSPVDLTVEQTINANAANRLTGITSFTNSHYARQRWNETHTARKAIITHLLEQLKLTDLSENSASEYQNKIFNRQVEKFIDEVCNNIDPFFVDLNRLKLFNISTGKAASMETTEFLLGAETNGRKQMEIFIKECREDRSRFDKPIKRNVLKNFTNEIPKPKGTSRTNIEEAKHERNILGQILCLAMKNSIDLGTVLSYPLTTTPHSLAHSDGSMVQNSKQNELFSLLLAKSGIKRACSSGHDVEIIDGFHMLNALKETPSKYGLLAQFVLKHVCNTSAHEIHLIFDKFESSSLKDLNWKTREEYLDSSHLSTIKINGPNQERVSSLSKCLMHHSFKEELISFFLKYWKDSEIVEILGDKRIFISFGNACYLFSKDHGNGTNLLSFRNNHTEVESRMILHLNKTRATDILIRTSDPEKMLVYLLYNMQYWPCKTIWIEIGDISKNTIEQINISEVYNSLNTNFVKALPAWYIFSGCAYEPSFYGIGRKTCFKHFEKKGEYHVAFANFGVYEPNDRDIQLIEEYTCQLYNSKLAKVNDARLSIFEKAYTSKNGIDFKKKGESYAWL